MRQAYDVRADDVGIEEGLRMGNGMMGPPMMVMGFVMMVLIVAALVVGVVWLVRAVTGDGRSPRHRSAIDQLEARYARGEIDRDEYFQRRNDLEGA